MNLDERLEALTQTVELLAGMHRDGEKRAQESEKRAQESEKRFQERLDKISERFSQQFSEHEQLFGQIALRLRDVSDGIDRLGRQTAARLSEVTASIDTLARIAGVHQERLDGHEQRLKDLEGPRN